MFTVEGYIDGVAYTLTVDPAREDDDNGIVEFCSPPDALSLLRLHDGRDVLLSPVGPSATVSLTDPEGVLSGLRALTEVARVTGDAPDVLADDEPSPPGTVY